MSRRQLSRQAADHTRRRRDTLFLISASLLAATDKWRCVADARSVNGIVVVAPNSSAAAWTMAQAIETASVGHGRAVTSIKVN